MKRAYRDQARVFKALGHPLRLRILYALREEGQYVCHLVALLGTRQPTVSQHLAVLRHAGLVVCEREGNRILYRLNNGRILRLLRLLVGEWGQPARVPREVWRLCSCPRCVRRRQHAEVSASLVKRKE